MHADSIALLFIPVPVVTAPKSCRRRWRIYWNRPWATTQCTLHGSDWKAILTSVCCWHFFFFIWRTWRCLLTFGAGSFCRQRKLWNSNGIVCECHHHRIGILYGEHSAANRRLHHKANDKVQFEFGLLLASGDSMPSELFPLTIYSLTIRSICFSFSFQFDAVFGRDRLQFGIQNIPGPFGIQNDFRQIEPFLWCDGLVL